MTMMKSLKGDHKMSEKEFALEVEFYKLICVYVV